MSQFVSITGFPPVRKLNVPPFFIDILLDSRGRSLAVYDQVQRLSSQQSRLPYFEGHSRAVWRTESRKVVASASEQINVSFDDGVYMPSSYVLRSTADTLIFSESFFNKRQ